MNQKSLSYWIPTGLFCIAFTAGGLAHFTHFATIAESMAKLGFPPFMMTIIGTAKLLGVVALLSPGRPLLKEWAYAGFTFNLLGAVASHLFAGDPIAESVPPALLLCLGAASYYFRPADRRLTQSIGAVA